YLGADEHIRATSVFSEEAVVMDLATGERVFTLPLGREAASRYGDGMYHAHRADLLDAMLDQLPAEHIRLNSRVEAIEERPDSVSVQLASGEEIAGYILIGADGLKSAVRTTLFGEQEARFTGHVAWRALIPSASALDDVPRTPSGASWLGQNRH